MDCTDQTSICRDQKYAATGKRIVPSHAHQGSKLRDMLMSVDPNLSYADLRHESARVQNAPKHVHSQQNHVSGKTIPREDELVRYMSKLPSFLEKGKKLHDQPLNIGVLDWRRLEKWRHSKEQITRKHDGCSPSSSNTSLFSTDESSTHSSRGPSCSPANQRTHRPEKSQDFDAFTGNPGKFKDSTSISSASTLSRQQMVSGVLQQHGRKASDSKSLSEKGRQSGFDKNGLVRNTRTERNRSAKETLSSRETKLSAAHRYYYKREEPEVVIPRNWSENSCSGASTSTYFTANDRLLVEPGPRNITRRNYYEDILPTKVHSRGCSIVYGSQDRENIANSFQASETLVQTSKASQTFSCPVRMLRSPSREESTEEKNLGAGLRSVTAAKPSEELEVRKNTQSVPKVRNQSPIRRLSFTVGKMIKNAGSRDNSPLRRPISKDSSMSIDNSCSEKSSANSNNNTRGKSSPLKRLLDPFLKIKGSNCNEPSKKRPSSPPLGAGKSCNDQVDCCNSVKVKSRSSGDDSKSGLSSLQGLLQISFKNGFPLFTFASDNESDILAATVRKSSVPDKSRQNWTYTFYTVRETTRKSGIWLNKSDSRGYVPNVVAQMKVSDSPFTKYENDDFRIIREFDLFAVDDSHEEDPHSTDFHPTNELAAIIVKLPRISNQNDTQDDQLNYNWLDISDDDFLRFPRDLNFSTTIILPSDVHTIPSKGEISTLVQRWMSGGSCDCGGWDLGCQLLVYSNKTENDVKTDSSDSCSSSSAHTFQLFSQVSQDSQPVLSLARFKDKIYSVEFSSSLSVLQAFAACISFLDRKRPPEKIKDEVSVGVFDLTSKMKTQVVNASPRYVSFPPDSTVERV